MEHELLDTARHASVRMRKATVAGRHFVQVVPTEFAAVAARCPILFTKHGDTGRFYAGAVCGFVSGENLLVPGGPSDDGQPTDFAMPLDSERQGFFISGDAIAFDPADPRFVSGTGDPLFDDGQPSEQLQVVQHALKGLKIGLEQTDDLVQSLLEVDLIEPIDITLRFDDGERITLEGLYTVSRDAMGDLDDVALVRLARSGHLQLAWTMATSLSQIPLLAKRRNTRLVGAQG